MERANASEIPASLAETSTRQRAALAIGVVCALLWLAGCQDKGVRIPPSVESHILSDLHYDGDIEQTSPTTFLVTQGMTPTIQSVLAGIDPLAHTEFRAFLNFPLGGPGGVPANAIIDWAYLEVLVLNVMPRNGSIPIRVELVEFQPPTLVASDFDRTALPPLGAVVVSGDVTAADIGQYVPVDVTPLMLLAQQRGVIDFQVRILEDLGPPSFTLMEIDNPITSDRPDRAPLLEVTWH